MCSKEILEVHIGRIFLGRPRRTWKDDVRMKQFTHVRTHARTRVCLFVCLAFILNSKYYLVLSYFLTIFLAFGNTPNYL